MYTAALKASISVDILAKFLKAVYLVFFNVAYQSPLYVTRLHIKILHRPIGSRRSSEVLLMLAAPNTEA